MDEYGPCPICGGAAVDSDYDRSAGQVSCGGECGWAFPADAWRRLADAAALAAAVGRLEARIRALVAQDGQEPVVLTATIDYANAGMLAGLGWGNEPDVEYVEGDGGTLAEALCALDGEVGDG